MSTIIAFVLIALIARLLRTGWSMAKQQELLGPHVSKINQLVNVAMVDKQPDLASADYALKQQSVDVHIKSLIERGEKHDVKLHRLAAMLNVGVKDYWKQRWLSDGKTLILHTKLGNVQLLGEAK